MINFIKELFRKDNRKELSYEEEEEDLFELTLSIVLTSFFFVLLIFGLYICNRSFHFFINIMS